MMLTTNAKQHKAKFLAGVVLMVAVFSLKPSDGEGSSICNEMSLTDATALADNLVGKLKVANYRADVPSMENYVNGFYDDDTEEDVIGLVEFIDSCSADRYPRVCGYSCHLELAQYYYLRSGNIVLLSNRKIKEESLGVDALNTFAHAGVLRMEKALDYVSYFVKSGGGQEERLSDFLRRKAALTAWLVKLHLNAGDNYYKSVARGQLIELAALADNSLSVTSSSAKAEEANSAYKSAWEKYKAAKWLLIEGVSDIPGNGEFGDLSAEYATLENEVAERLSSIENGNLFLGIDSRKFPKQNFDMLMEDVTKVSTSIDGVENQIASIVRNWVGDEGSYEAMQIDEQRYVNARNIDLLGNAITELDQSAREMQNDLEQRLNRLNTTTHTFAERSQLAEINYELKKTELEFNHQTSVLESKKQIDLLAFDQELKSLERDEIRFLINMEISDTNLELQRQALDEQILQYERQISQNNSRIDQLLKQKEQREIYLENEDLSIEMANEEIIKINTLKTDIYELERSGLLEQICAIESRITFVGDRVDSPYIGENGTSPCYVPEMLNGDGEVMTKVEYADQICSIRDKLGENDIEKQAYVLKCVLGGSIPNDIKGEIEDEENLCIGPLSEGNFLQQNELTFIEKINAYQLASIKDTEYGQVQIIKNAKKNLETYIEDLTDQFDEYKLGARIGQHVLHGIGAIWTVLSAIPDLSVSLFGPGSTVNVARPFETAYAIAKDAHQFEMSLKQMDNSYDNQKQELRNQINNMKDEIAKLENIDAPLREKVNEQTMFKLLGHMGELTKSLSGELIKNELTETQCGDTKNDLENQIQSLKSEHRRLLIELNKHGKRNDLYDHDINRQELIKNQSENQKRVYMSQLEELDIQIESLAEDNKLINDQLIPLVVGRQGTIASLREEINELQTMSDDATLVIQELVQRRKDQATLLSDAEITHLKNIYEQGNAYFEDRISAISTQVENIGLGLDMQYEVLGAVGRINDSIKAKRDELTDLISNEIEETVLVDGEGASEWVTKKTKIFLLSQEKIANILKGLPEYLETKNDLLNRANIYLQLMRSRFDALMRMSNAVDLGAPGTDFAYITDGTSLREAIDNYYDFKRTADQEVLLDYVEFEIPSDSALAETLQQDGQVTFRIDPSTDSDMMWQNGYLTLWDDDKIGGNNNVRVVDVFVGANYSKSATQRHRITVKHFGDGVLYTPDSSGGKAHRMAVEGARARNQYIYDLAGEETEFYGKVHKWVSQSISLFSFPGKELQSGEKELAFMGLPIAGTWQLRLDAAREKPDAGLKIGFVIVKTY